MEPKHENEEPLRLRGGWKRVLPAALILLCSGALLWVKSDLLWQETEEGGVFCRGFLIVYSVLTAASVFLCFLEARLPLTARRAVGWALLLALPIGAFYGVDMMNGTRILTFPALRWLGNYLCCLLPFLLCYALTRSAFWAVLLGGGACLLFGAANYFVVQFRGQPILPWDISAALTAMEVAGGYKFALTRPMLLSLEGLLCAALACRRFGAVKGAELPRAHRIAEHAAAGVCAAALVVLLFPANILSHMQISVWAWNQKTSSEITGTLAGFVANVQFLLVEKPEDYSEERVAELQEKLNALPEPEPIGSPEKQPTIVVVMNESLTDLQAVGDVEFAPDNLPFIHSLQQSGQVLWGTAYSSVYGGNTCNSEYEFLTGNTTAFLPSGSKPYQQYVDHEQTALPSILADYGYERIAIHPGNRAAWQRNTAYPFLDFNEFISARTFDVKRELLHGLTSDASNYDQVIYEYEHRDRGKGLFLFNVTIQNHGGYEDEDVPVTVRIKKQTGEGVYEGEVIDPDGEGSAVTVRTEESEGDAQEVETAFPQAEQYLSLTRASDEAFEGLIDYFAAQEDPVVVLLFGDHWPNLEQGFLKKLLRADPNDLEFEDLMREYQVPFLIWANYPLEIPGDGRIDGVSLNYLSGLLLRAAGLEGTPYTRFLEDLRQTLPVITAVGVMDSEGNFYKNGEETPYDELLNEYAILQYNNAFGEDGKAESLFRRQGPAGENTE